MPDSYAPDRQPVAPPKNDEAGGETPPASGKGWGTGCLAWQWAGGTWPDLVFPLPANADTVPIPDTGPGEFMGPQDSLWIRDSRIRSTAGDARRGCVRLTGGVRTSLPPVCPGCPVRPALRRTS